MRTENSHREFPLSTKHQMPSQLTVREPRKALFIHSEEKKDMLLGDSFLVDAVMCLPDSPSRKDLMSNCKEVSISLPEAFPHNKWGRGIKTRPFQLTGYNCYNSQRQCLLESTHTLLACLTAWLLSRPVLLYFFFNKFSSLRNIFYTLPQYLLPEITACNN